MNSSAIFFATINLFDAMAAWAAVDKSAWNQILLFLLGSCLSVAYFNILLKGVTPIPPDRNTAGFE